MIPALALALSCAHVSQPTIHLGDDVGLRSARLIAQAPPPLPLRPPDAVAPGARELELQQQIDGINERLRGTSADWPTSSLVMAWVGWSFSPLVLVGGLLLLAGSATGISALVLVGLGVLIAGLGAVALGIAGIVTGLTSSNAAKAERNDLIRQRSELESELKLLRRQPGSVERSWDLGAPLVTVASF